MDFGAPDSEGFRYGLTYCDHLTKYLDLIPLKDKTPKSVCQGLVKLFCRFGIPDQCVSDNGSEFVAHMTQRLFQHFGIYHSKISPYNPGGNRIERCHRTISELIKIYQIPAESWSAHIHMIIYLYNSQPQDSLNGNSPFELLFLRKQRDCFESETISNLNK